LLLKLFGTKIVFTAHNILPHDSENKFKWIFGKIYKTLDTIIVHSSKTKSELENSFKVNSQKIKVVPHGLLNNENVDPEKVVEHIDFWKKKFSLHEKTTFCFLGGLALYKGIDIVIDAWNKIESTKMHLLIGGVSRGNYLKKLKPKPNVTLIERYLSHEEFDALMEVSDYVLLPYRKISQSGVLLTALNKRKKVIVTDKGGLTEPFQFGDIGIIIDNLSEVHLLNAIESARKKCNENIPNKVWEQIDSYYDWRKIGEKTKKVYESVLN
jgi:glycosyltransferase involved in cell wall biosynthesis